MRRVLRRFLASCAVIVGLFAVMLAPVANAQSDQVPSGSGQGFQISPVLVELNAEPGKTYTLSLTVKNTTAGALTVRPTVNDFAAKDETGTPAIIEQDTNNATYSLRRWVNNVASFKLAAQESRKVDVVVDVPRDAEPGGHYGVVRFSGVAPDQDSAGAALSASVGTLVLARVAGDIKEDLSIKEFFVQKDGKRKGIFDASPITLVQRLENKGNIHLKPRGSVEVKDMFGNTTQSISINEDGRRNVLPDSIRRFEQTLDKKRLFGRYSASLNLAYGTTGQVVTSTINFWVIPFTSIIIVLVGLVALVFALRYGIRRYNAHIVKKANRR